MDLMHHWVRVLPRMAGNHIHGNWLLATLGPGRRNARLGHWAANKIFKKSLASLFHC